MCAQAITLGESVSLDNQREQLYSGEVQLTGGEYPSEGRLAVFFNGQWGGVCSSGFDPSDGDVVCRQMGYTHVESVTSSAGVVCEYPCTVYTHVQMLSLI